jgi:hypothetical protein
MGIFGPRFSRPTPRNANSENSTRIPLLLLRNDHFLAVGYPFLELLLGVFPLVLLPALDSRQLLSLDALCLLDNCRQVSVVFDPADLGHVREALDQGFVVLQSRPLPGALHPAASRCLRPPQPHCICVSSTSQCVFLEQKMRTITVITS